MDSACRTQADDIRITKTSFLCDRMLEFEIQNFVEEFRPLMVEVSESATNLASAR
jgi:hypothetical protein